MGVHKSLRWIDMVGLWKIPLEYVEMDDLGVPLNHSHDSGNAASIRRTYGRRAISDIVQAVVLEQIKTA